MDASQKALNVDQRIGSRLNGSRILMLVATASWLGFIFYSGLMPRLPQIPLVFGGTALSSLGHFSLYFVLVFNVYLLLINPPKNDLRRRVIFLTAAAGFSFVVGLAIEGLQFLVIIRAGQVIDAAFNGFGVIAGSVAIILADRIKINFRVQAAMVSFVVFSMILFTTVSAMIWDPALPRVGDHWHARYTISACGKAVSPLPGVQGGVHTHGHGGIHIHPVVRSQAGTNANLSLFMRTSGAQLTDESLTLSGGKTYANGYLCPGGRPGALSVTVDGEPIPNPSSHVLKNRQTIAISFEPTAE